MSLQSIGQGASNLVADGLKKEFLLAEAVIEGAMVCLSGATGYTVENTDATTDDGIGFAAAAGSAGDWVEVYYSGYCPKAYVDSSTDAGDLLASGATAGRGVSSTTKTPLSVAVALEADVSNYAAVMVFTKF